MGHQEKYGGEYKNARKEKIQSMPVPHDEVTFGTKNLESHHSQPKMFHGPDIKENLIILTRDFHQYIHDICNVKDNELIYKRKHFANKIWNDPNSLHTTHAKKRIEEIDDVLMREYIENMIVGISEKYKMQVIRITLFSQMNTIREQAIKIRQLEESIISLTSSLNEKKRYK